MKSNNPNFLLKEKVIYGADISTPELRLSGQFSIPNVVYDAYSKTKEGQHILRQIILTIQKDGELNKIASEDPIEKKYGQMTAQDFWKRFSQVNSELYNQLAADFKGAFPTILKFKITKVATGADPNEFENLDVKKNREVFGAGKMPSFQDFMQTKAVASGGTAMKQTPVTT